MELLHSRLANEDISTIHASVARRQEEIAAATTQRQEDGKDAMHMDVSAPAAQWQGPPPRLPPRNGAACVLVVTQDQEEYENIKRDAEHQDMQAVPVKLNDAASAEAITRRLEECIASKGVDAVIVSIGRQWHTDCRSAIAPWGQPYANTQSLEKTARGNRMAATAIRLGMACHRAGIPATIITPEVNASQTSPLEHPPSHGSPA